MRGKLIELIDAFRELDAPHDGRTYTEHLADHLLACGVIVLTCKAGDTVYQTDGIKIYTSKVNRIFVLEDMNIYSTGAVDFDDRAIGKTVFLTREEVEKALAEREDADAEAQD